MTGIASVSVAGLNATRILASFIFEVTAMADANNF